MIRFELFAGLVVFGLCIFCLVDVIGTRDDEVRNLPKLWWLLLVLFFPFVGSVAWLVAGRPQPVSRAHGSRATGYPEYDRPGRAVASNPQADEDFLRQVRERAEEQRRQYRERRRAEEDEHE